MRSEGAMPHFASPDTSPAYDSCTHYIHSLVQGSGHSIAG